MLGCHSAVGMDCGHFGYSASQRQTILLAIPSLKTEKARSSETPVSTYQTTQRRTPEDNRTDILTRFALSLQS